MKVEGLKNYFSNILQKDYLINPIKLRIVDLISCMSILFGLEWVIHKNVGIYLDGV